MYKCIYTGSAQPASTAEHIFPKCIGGSRKLPVGYVADEVNNAFSKMELEFARQYPPVVIARMFSGPTGRKKHKKRKKIGFMKDQGGNTGYMLGFVQNGIPRAIDQIVISTEKMDERNGALPAQIIMGPNEKMSKEKQLAAFWESLRAYNGSPQCIKGLHVPPKTYLLGTVDNGWFLGISKSENPETIKPELKRIVAQTAAMDINALLSKSQMAKRRQRVETEFSFAFNYVDVMRVYAKIAVNCLAAVKGHDFVMSPALHEIKRAILTGDGIETYTTYSKGPNPIPEKLRRFPDRALLGEKPHCAVFFQEPCGDLIAFIALYGADDPVAVKLGRFGEPVGIDLYICDWENRTDYTMYEFAKEICKYHG